MANKIGSLWEKMSSKGMTFYSGNITINGVQTAIVVFPNKKSKDTHPDFVIQESTPYVSNKPKQAPKPQSNYDDEEDIAF